MPRCVPRCCHIISWTNFTLLQRPIYYCFLSHSVLALFAMMISVAGFVTLLCLGVPVVYVYHKYLQLTIAATVVAYLLSAYLYAHSFFVPDESLAAGGNSGEYYYYYWQAFVAVSVTAWPLPDFLWVFWGRRLYFSR